MRSAEGKDGAWANIGQSGLLGWGFGCGRLWPLNECRLGVISGCEREVGRTPRGGRVVGGSERVGHVVVGGSEWPSVTRGEDNPERVPLCGGWRGPSGGG